MIARRYEERLLASVSIHFMIRTSPTRARFSRRHAASPRSSTVRTSATGSSPLPRCRADIPNRNTLGRALRVLTAEARGRTDVNDHEARDTEGAALQHGCGGVVDCGLCPDGFECGYGGMANVCGRYNPN